MLSLFQNGVDSGDYLHVFAVTMEWKTFTMYVGQYMIDHRGEGKGSIITSVHNSRVELIKMFILGCWPFMHAFLRQWKMKAVLEYLMMFIYSAFTISMFPGSIENEQSPSFN